MSYFTENQLRGYAKNSSKVSIESFNESANFSCGSKKRAFLSHSHKDRELAEGMKNHLHSAGFDLYIDWQDSSMPSTTNAETARKIKNKIASSDVILVLATKNAMESKWVPWEIGIADERKGTNKVLIIPVQDSNGRFHGNEYIQIYKKIIIADDNSTAIFSPNEKYGTRVRSYNI